MTALTIQAVDLTIGEAMTITTMLQKQLVDGIGSVVITDIVQDPATQNYMREIRVYNPPDSTGAINLVFTLSLSSPVRNNIELTAPAAVF